MKTSKGDAMKQLEEIIIDYKEGMQIKDTCIIRGMPNEVYHLCEGLSTSGIKTLLDCPARYFYKYLSGEYEQKEKPAFKIGKACHTYILEGESVFYDNYYHNPYQAMLKTDLQKELDNRGIEYKKADKVGLLIWLLLEDDGIEHETKTGLNNNELNQVVSIGRAINNNKFAKFAFSQDGESELSIFWTDKETGLKLKCRPDFLPYNCVDIPDYKTAASVNPNTFFADFIKFGYHIQAACYRQGVNALIEHYNLNLEGVGSFFFVAQEKEPPYITQVYLPDMLIVDYGDKAIKSALKKYIECKNNGVWETYSNNIIELSLTPKPDGLETNFVKETGIAFAPYWVDRELLKY